MQMAKSRFIPASGMKVDTLDSRVIEWEKLRTSLERRKLFRHAAYMLHLDIFQVSAKRRDKQGE